MKKISLAVCVLGIVLSGCGSGQNVSASKNIDTVSHSLPKVPIANYTAPYGGDSFDPQDKFVGDNMLTVDDINGDTFVEGYKDNTLPITLSIAKNGHWNVRDKQITANDPAFTSQGFLHETYNGFWRENIQHDNNHFLINWTEMDSGRTIATKAQYLEINDNGDIQKNVVLDVPAGGQLLPSSEGYGLYLENSEGHGGKFINFDNPNEVTVIKDNYNFLGGDNVNRKAPLYLDFKNSDMISLDATNAKIYQINFKTGEPLYDPQGQNKTIHITNKWRDITYQNGGVNIYTNDNQYAYINLYNQNLDPISSSTINLPANMMSDLSHCSHTPTEDRFYDLYQYKNHEALGLASIEKTKE